jgi:tRNA(Ser,Leu) C12 N-acetylase TAN1
MTHFSVLKTNVLERERERERERVMGGRGIKEGPWWSGFYRLCLGWTRLDQPKISKKNS